MTSESVVLGFLLIVEDEPILRSLIVETLQDSGFLILAVATADEGLKVLEQTPISLLITDVETPGQLNGWELAQIARHLRPDIAIIISSGCNRREADPLPEGILYLAKPWTVEQLLDLVAERRHLLLHSDSKEGFGKQ